MLCVLLLTVIGVAPAPESAAARVARFVRTLELKESADTPSWYPRAEPRFRFVQVSDIHFHEGRGPILAEAAAFIASDVKPAFVMLTGDDAGSADRARQERFKALLDATFRVPCFIIRGDNWAGSFAEVFGSTQFSFDCGGIHFVAAGLDVDVDDWGIGLLEPDTIAWLRKECAGAGTPVIYFQHEPSQPPTFLGAPAVEEILEGSARAVLAMHGHLHVDFESRTGRVLHVMAPSFGVREPHGFKVVEVYADQLAIRTVERVDGAFRFVRKYQRVELPVPLRAKPEAFAIENLRKRPPRATAFDRRLLLRQGEIAVGLVAYARKIGRLGEFLSILAGGEPAAGPKGGQ